jgi:hypothetical protein
MISMKSMVKIAADRRDLPRGNRLLSSSETLSLYYRLSPSVFWSMLVRACSVCNLGQPIYENETSHKKKYRYNCLFPSGVHGSDSRKMASVVHSTIHGWNRSWSCSASDWLSSALFSVLSYLSSISSIGKKALGAPNKRSYLF